MKLLFVCSGNTCRSPMAEGIFNSFGLDTCTALSAGITVVSEDFAHPDAVAVCESKGIDISAHRSKPLTFDMVDSADKIVCMTDSHKRVLVSAGVNEDKIIALSIPDPYCRGREVYEECFKCIKNELKKLIFELKILKLCEFSQTDEKYIAALEAECFSEPWSETSVLSAANTGTRFILCKSNNICLGYGGVKIVSGEAYITNIAVTEKHRNLGIGRKILSELCELARKDGSEFISLEVRASNSVAIELYQSTGFEVCGKRKNFYSKPTEDAIILTKYFEGNLNSNENSGY